MLRHVFMINISPLCKTLYRMLVLKDVCDEGVSISVAELSKLLGSSRENVKEAIRSLQDEGLIEVMPQKHGPNIYKPITGGYDDLSTG